MSARRMFGAVACALIGAACTADDGPARSAQTSAPSPAPTAQAASATELVVSSDVDAAHAWVRLGMDLARDEGLTPLSAARLAGYLGLALHESVLDASSGERSLAGEIDGLGDLGERPARLRARVAMAEAASRVLTDHLASDAGRARIDEHLAAESASFDKEDPEAVETSRDWGAHVGERLVARSAQDGLSETSRPYTAPGGPGHWVPTPPGFAVPFEPYWGEMRRFLGPDHCPCPPPAPYDLTPGSAFRAEVDAVYQESQALDDADRKTAAYWDDQPLYTSTPPGHWVEIADETSAADGLDVVATTELHALLGVTLNDVGIDIWYWKYDHDLIRPVNPIRELYDPDWLSLIVTPPFPEYPSGHAGFSRAAATVLAGLVPDDGFVDTTHEERLGERREFRSFDEAANEAGFSRVLGGIHYPMGNQGGQAVGRCVAEAALALVDRSEQ